MQNFDKDRLRRQIREMQEKIDYQISYLNNGGCIHFANIFSKRLKELGIPHKIVYMNYDFIGKTYFTFSPVSHVGVYIRGIGVVDGYRTKQLADVKKNRNVKFRDFDLNLICKIRGWNPMYRLENNKILEEVINEEIN